MDFTQLMNIENECERVNKTYDLFHEDSRLNHSKAASACLADGGIHLLFVGEKK